MTFGNWNNNMFSATSCPNRFLVWARALHPASTSAVRSCDLRHIHPKTSLLKLSLSLMYRAWSGVAAVALRLVQIWCLWVLEAFTTTSATWLFHSACSVVPSWSTLLSSDTPNGSGHRVQFFLHLQLLFYVSLSIFHERAPPCLMIFFIKLLLKA